MVGWVGRAGLGVRVARARADGPSRVWHAHPHFTPTSLCLCQAELGAFYPLLLLRPLEGDAPDAGAAAALDGLRAVAAQPQLLVDLFVNFDCDMQAGWKGGGRNEEWEETRRGGGVGGVLACVQVTARAALRGAPNSSQAASPAVPPALNPHLSGRQPVGAVAAGGGARRCTTRR